MDWDEFGRVALQFAIVGIGFILFLGGLFWVAGTAIMSLAK